MDRGILKVVDIRSIYYYFLFHHILLKRYGYIIEIKEDDEYGLSEI